MKNPFIYIVFVVLLAGCQKDTLQDDIFSYNDIIRFSVGEGIRIDGESATRSFTPEVSANYVGEVVLRSDSGEEMTLDILEQPLSGEDYSINNITTKGIPATTGNLSTVYDGSEASKEIWVKAFFEGNSAFPYIDDYLKYDAKDGWGLSLGTSYWPKVWRNIRFWAWAHANINPSITFSSNNAVGIKYDYAIPSSGKGDDAVNQPDVMVAYKRYTSKPSSGNVSLDMKHALAALNFNLKKTIGGKLKSIAIGNMSTSGTCTVTISDSSPSFVWSDLAGSADYCQTFDKEIKEDPDGGTTQAITSADDGTVFMVVPQEGTGKSVTVVITSENGKDVSFSGVMPTVTWKAGKSYTYIISDSDAGTVEITVEDSVSGNVKNQLKISNSGNAREYVRAAIVANWYDEDGNIVAPWVNDPSSPATSGVFEGLPTDTGGSGARWIFLDGYYYYTAPLHPGSETETKLFTKFTAPSPAPVTGAKLHMKILAQGVLYDSSKSKVGTAWGTAIKTYLSVDSE